MIAIGLDVLVDVILMHGVLLFMTHVLMEVSPDYAERSREMLYTDEPPLF